MPVGPACTPVNIFVHECEFVKHFFEELTCEISFLRVDSKVYIHNVQTAHTVVV